jgi:predicted metal-dependent phosphoesterase TrpH/glycosyltransferase involved in cell wall biosynthesis
VDGGAQAAVHPVQAVSSLRGVAEKPFSIAQVTPYPWEQHHEVNRFVERLSDELCRRGHRVVVVAPSESRELIRDSREIIRRAAADPAAVFAADGCAQVLGVGQSIPFPSSRRGGPVALPVDVSRTIEELLDRADFDFVHVHEPFAPSAASAALRHSNALNVGTFHSATERVLSTQVARRLVELLFGRLDGRTATFKTTRDQVARFFPGEYRVIAPGADLAPRAAAADGRPGREVVEIVYTVEEERSALRQFLRALRRLPADLPWAATVWARSPASLPQVPIARAIRDRVRFVGPADGSAAQFLASAQVVVAASNGAAPAPGALLRGMAGGAVPVASRLPEYEEAVDDGELGLLFEPRDTEVLAAQLTRLVGDPELLATLRQRVCAIHDRLSWTHVADQFEELYTEIAGRRHDPAGKPDVRRRLAGRELIAVDLHMHTNHSHDCATPVDKLLETAIAQGLGAIAVTDHNEVSGALEASARANGIKVIVGEEVKTADQGEVIGLFLQEKIARGLSLEETIAEIKRQGGLVYVPHPFDRMHSVPDYEHLLKVVEDVDAIEVFNPRVAFSAFNEEAEIFAQKYRIVAGAGSDSHVAQGLGSVKIMMRDFDGPEEFLESLRDADIIRKRQSLLYVQALKFIQTKSPSARRARSGAR